MTQVATRDALIAAALDRAGARDYASDSFIEGLDIYLGALGQSETVSDAGIASLERQMTGYLANRFASEAYLAEHPALDEGAIEAPIFVLGMPRTGTTMMVNLLHQDSAARTLRKWEANLPVPPAAAGELSTDQRCLTLNAERRREVAEGKLKTNIHFEWYDEPTECVYLMMQDFRSTAWDMFVPVPAYSEYLLGCDVQPMYRWHRRVLQMLQESNRGRWTLKAPGHALFGEALLALYPDARIIWTHRDPFVAVASLASLAQGVHRRFQPEPDRAWIRDFYPRQLAEHANRMLALEQAHPGRVFHVRYDDLESDPLRATERLYAEMGLPMSKATRAAIAAWIAANPRHKHGGHSYGLDDFGIDRARIARLFGDYLDRQRMLAPA